MVYAKMGEAANTTGHNLERRINPRRKRFWAIVLVLLYTLFGFFLAPYLIKNTVVNLFQDDLGRTATIGKVKVNPYVLSLEVQGFEILDKDNVKLASFDDIFVNFQLFSLFKWAWVFKEVRLDAPFPPDPDEDVDEQAATATRLLKKIHLRQALNDRLGVSLVENEDQNAMMLDELAYATDIWNQMMESG